ASSRLSVIVQRLVSTSPGRTGTGKRTSSTPGAPSEATRPKNPSQNMRIIIAQVCNCEAQRHAFASSGGSGSKSRRKARISSRSTILHPSLRGLPITRSSWCSISPTPFLFLRLPCAFSHETSLYRLMDELSAGGELLAHWCAPLAQTARRVKPAYQSATFEVGCRPPTQFAKRTYITSPSLIMYSFPSRRIL